MLTISNSGQAVASTNYWQSEHARAGLFYLTWNAGAGRLLVPDSQKPSLQEMRNARMVIVSRGPWTDRGGCDSWELLFEDDSDCPFAITLMADQSDRVLPESDQGGGLVITVWTCGGQKLRLPGKYRRVAEIPCLDPWTTL